jgi:hypothetical protein
MRSGRKPAGSKLVDGLNGSHYAKERLRQIIRTLSGEATIEEACQELQISRTRFYDLRQSVLGDMLERLEPRPAGRPPQEPETSDEVGQLEHTVERLEWELEATQVRMELNTLFPLTNRKKNDR